MSPLDEAKARRVRAAEFNLMFPLMLLSHVALIEKRARQFPEVYAVVCALGNWQLAWDEENECRRK